MGTGTSAQGPIAPLPMPTLAAARATATSATVFASSRAAGLAIASIAPQARTLAIFALPAARSRLAPGVAEGAAGPFGRTCTPVGGGCVFGSVGAVIPAGRPVKGSPGAGRQAPSSSRVGAASSTLGARSAATEAGPAVQGAAIIRTGGPVGPTVGGATTASGPARVAHGSG